MRLFFAGSEPEPYQQVLQRAGVENVLQSYWFIVKSSCPQNRYKFFLLDSGGFSARKNGVEINIKEYADYLNKNKVKFAFNLDVASIPKSLENQRYLEESTNTYIIPIYHGAEWLDPYYKELIQYYCEFYPYISVGGLAGQEVNKANQKRVLNYIFSLAKDKVRVHGLGQTSKPILFSYPFYSVDSTSWLQITRYASSRIHSDEMARVRARK